MTYGEVLFTQLMEECAEVIQAVTKAKRFGLDGRNIRTGQTNIEHLEEEIGDVVSVIEEMQRIGMISPENQKVRIKKKERFKEKANIAQMRKSGYYD